MDRFTHRRARRMTIRTPRAARVLVDGSRYTIVRRWVADEALAAGETVS
jgi:hypothetical protein